MSASKLVGSRVYRGGVTARSLDFETADLTIESFRGVVAISFDMSSKGGGTTRVSVQIKPDDFSAIVTRIAEADRQTTMTAMTQELARRVAEQPQHDQRIADRTFRAVVDAADEQYRNAPVDEDHAEKFILDSVTKLVEKLRKPDTDKTAKAA